MPAAKYGDPVADYYICDDPGLLSIINQAAAVLTALVDHDADGLPTVVREAEITMARRISPAVAEARMQWSVDTRRPRRYIDMYGHPLPWFSRPVPLVTAADIQILRDAAAALTTTLTDNPAGRLAQQLATVTLNPGVWRGYDVADVDPQLMVATVAHVADVFTLQPNDETLIKLALSLPQPWQPNHIPQ